MSMILKAINPNIANIQVFSPQGAIRAGIQTPINSSMTTVLGSSPQYFSIILEVHAPTTVTVIVVINVTQNKTSTGNNLYPAHHKASATNAPAVPGAIGTKPAPNHVDNIT